MTIYTEHAAVQRIATLTERIQELHAEARDLAERFEIRFTIELEGGQNYNVESEYHPWSASADSHWDSSSC